MRIVISDTTCLIDLGKVTLIEEMLRLPYTFVMPSPLFEDELISLPSREKTRLRKLGLQVRDLPGPLVARAAVHFNRHGRLTLNDCFALTLAEATEDSILLTGDAALRGVAEEQGIEARGVLWVTDQLQEHAIISLRRLHEALVALQEDQFVFLPAEELVRRIRRLARLI